MRKPAYFLAPAIVLATLSIGGYRLAAQPTPVAARQIVPQGLAAVTGAPQAAVETATPVPATATAAPTLTRIPTNPPAATATTEPTATPQPTATTRPTATSSPTSAPQPTEAPQIAAAAVLAAPDRIVAPAIGLDVKVVTMGWHEVTDSNGSKHTEWDVASYAAGWHKNSAKPGQVGNTVIAGHNNIEGEVFRNLEKFEIGDDVTLYAGGRAYIYTVVDKFVVPEKGVPYEERVKNAKWIGAFLDERVTMVSCWPPTNNTHRMFVVAKPKS